MRLPSRILTGSLALAVGLGLVAAASPGNAQVIQAQQRMRITAAAQEALDHLLARVPAVPLCPQGTVQSTNWGGQAICVPAGEVASNAAGSFTVGHIPICEECYPPREAVFTVGIDGFSSDSFEGAGVYAYQYGNSTIYYSWWDMYPSDPVLVSDTVQPGDDVTVSVKRSGSSYILSLTDFTNPGNSFTTTKSCSGCANSSAEWITMSSAGNPLPDFGAWTVTNATATVNGNSGGISAFPNTSITMVDSSNNVMVRPGPLNANGTGFTATWEDGT